MKENIFEEMKTFNREEELNTVVFASHFGAQIAFKAVEKNRFEKDPETLSFEGDDAPVTLRFPVTMPVSDRDSSETKTLQQYPRLTFGYFSKPEGRLARIRATIDVAKALVEEKQPLEIIPTNPPYRNVGPQGDIPASIFNWKSQAVSDLLDEFSCNNCDPEFPGMSTDKRLWFIANHISEPGDSVRFNQIDLKTIGNFDPFIIMFLEKSLEASRIHFRYLKPKRVFTIAGTRHVVDQNGELILPLHLFA